MDVNKININYFITDHLGSVRVITDNAGNIKEQNDYYPFGMRHTNANLMISANRWGFNGKEKQVTQNLNYLDYGARMYDDFTGRWFVQDLLAEKYYPISSYVYCLNSPVKFIDPDGRKVSILRLSDTHRKSLQTFMATKTGMAFVGRYMRAGETLVVSGQKYAFDKTGDRAKDLLSFQSANLPENTLGQNRTMIKGTSRLTNDYNVSEVDNAIANGVQQTIGLSNSLDEKTAVGVLGHEAFVHANNDADALNELEANSPNMKQNEKENTFRDISNKAPQEHKDLGDGKATKFKQYMNEATKVTGDRYYEEEYRQQVLQYKTR